MLRGHHLNYDSEAESRDIATFSLSTSIIPGLTGRSRTDKYWDGKIFILERVKTTETLEE